MLDKILLIDGNSILNRAFYALPILTNKDGLFTNGVYGFLTMLFKLYEEEKPKYMIVAFDVPKPTFRHHKFNEYKGTRKPMPDELRPQFDLLKEVLNSMNIKICELEGYEADDILGTLAAAYEADNCSPIIISGDKDLLQMASDNIQIKISKTKLGKTIVEDYYAKDVLEKIGVTPKQFIDVKALMGDKSDNIPGVPGIGEKTAINIIKEYKTLENALENIENIKSKRAAQNLKQFKEQAVLSKQLATILTSVPLKINLEETLANNIFNSASLNIIKKLDFKSFFPLFSNNFDEGKKDENFNTSIISTLEEAEVHCKGLLNSKLVAFTTITEDKQLIGLTFTTQAKQGEFVNLINNEKKVKILNLYKEFFESDVNKIALNAKKELSYFEKNNIKIKNLIFDSEVAFYVIDANKGSYNVSDISSNFLNEYYPIIEEVLGKGKSKLKLIDLNINELASYCCRQSDICFRSYPILKQLLEQNGQSKLYYEMEFPLITVLKDMELAGIKINKKELVNYGHRLQNYINILVNDIYIMADEEFNINSPQQLGSILFEKLGLKATKKTKTGYSTNAEVLVKLADKHPIIPKIIEYRTHTKLKTTYVEGLLAALDEDTHKIYSTFNQTIASTGRISSTEPNLQNIPIKLELGRELRKVFVPTDDNYVFLDGDYSQIELRVLAHMSGDEILINAFKEDMDIHTITASQVFNIPIKEVTSIQRNNAKAVNFGIVYGISAFSLSVDLGITKKEAEQYISSYFNKYPKVKQYLDTTVQQAKRNGYVSTLFGRRRDIPELNSSNFIQRGFGERVAMNMPIQGTAADIIKFAMINIHKRLLKEKLVSRLILQVHDELLLEVKKDEVNIVIKILEEEMNKAANLKVPMKTECHLGNTFYDTK